ncbi:HAD family hydrolase [Streptomyces sp. NBC_01590]|uniref:HAD family hydrolase n=1 Tax=Streptomyces sp. NBC_01590 TaxID=2975887 RepID=UPI003863A2E7
MVIRAVLWDIDDTIFDHTTADRIGTRKHLEQHGLPDGYENVEQALVAWRELSDAHWVRFAAGETDFRGQRRERVREFLSRALDDAEADDWFARHAAHYEAAWSLFPDVLPVLDLLAEGFRHAVLSNASIQNQDPKLRRLGVRDRFEAVVCAVELGVSKPDAGAFHAACEVLALEPGEVAYVGNEPDIDAGGAVAAGLMGIWLDRAGLGGRPELVRISGLDQLPGLLGPVRP